MKTENLLIAQYSGIDLYFRPFSVPCIKRKRSWHTYTVRSSNWFSFSAQQTEGELEAWNSTADTIPSKLYCSDRWRLHRDSRQRIGEGDLNLLIFSTFLILCSIFLIIFTVDNQGTTNESPKICGQGYPIWSTQTSSDNRLSCLSEQFNMMKRGSPNYSWGWKIFLRVSKRLGFLMDWRDSLETERKIGAGAVSIINITPSKLQFSLENWLLL